jgi:hypothetical protein
MAILYGIYAQTKIIRMVGDAWGASVMFPAFAGDNARYLDEGITFSEACIRIRHQLVINNLSHHTTKEYSNHCGAPKKGDRII